MISRKISASRFQSISTTSEAVDPTTIIGHRIVILGPSGAGKTTLARVICDVYRLPHVPLDALSWDPGPRRCDVQVFRERVALAVEGEYWVVDGQYPQVRDIVWSRADTIIWLDYSLWVCARRLVGRRIKSAGQASGVQIVRCSNRLSSFGRYFDLVRRTLRCKFEQVQTPRHLQEYPNHRLIRLANPASAEKWLELIQEAHQPLTQLRNREVVDA
jgi:adenylate kinase family enzyme